MSVAVEVRDLKKSYGSHMVLKGLDFKSESVEIIDNIGRFFMPLGIKKTSKRRSWVPGGGRTLNIFIHSEALCH